MILLITIGMVLLLMMTLRLTTPFIVALVILFVSTSEQSFGPGK